MKLTIESTDIKLNIDGVECRLWRGTLDNGATIELCVHRLRTDDPLVDLSEFDERETPEKVDGGPSQLQLIIDHLIDDQARSEVLCQSIDESAPAEFRAGMETGLSVVAMLLRVARQADAKADVQQVTDEINGSLKGMIERLEQL